MASNKGTIFLANKLMQHIIESIGQYVIKQLYFKTIPVAKKFVLTQDDTQTRAKHEKFIVSHKKLQTEATEETCTLLTLLPTKLMVEWKGKELFERCIRDKVL